MPTTRRIMTLVAAAAAALAVGAALGGCGTTTAPPSSSSSSSSTAAAGTHNQADITFAQGMISHHAQAIAMSLMAAQQAGSPQVKDLAARIQAAQQPEIDQMAKTSVNCPYTSIRRLSTTSTGSISPCA